MDPLSPNDPLHKLLGKAKPVDPRPNFTQNVLRAIRQVPQKEGVWERVQALWSGMSTPRLALGGAVAALVAGTLMVAALQQPAPQAPVVAVVAEQDPAPVVQSQPAPQAQPAAQPPVYNVSTAMIFAATAGVTPASQPAPVAEVDDMDPMEVLLVQQDTSALTDSELALLVY